MKLKLSKKDIKANRGITLIALVITIIVLLILAGVTIATLTGDNGLLTKAGDARNTSEKAGEKERIQMEVAGAYDLTGKLVASQVEENIRNNIKDITNVTATAKEGTEEKFFPVKATYNNGHKYQVDENGQIMMSVNAGDKAPSDSNAVYSSGDYTAIIPAGFTVSATESSIENGLVVTDGSENEWVWIPVANVTDLYIENTTNNEWILCGTSGESKVVSQYASGAKLDAGNNITRTTPGTTTAPYYREPDTVVGNGTEYDAVADNRKVAGFVESDGTTASSLETMAKVLRDDYKNMIDSVRKNGGFYVGRYELSSAGTKKDQPSLTDTNWYNLYAKCKTFGDENTICSRMIWGCQWDQVCKFINTSGDKVSLTNSRTYGNCYSSQAPANTGNYEQSKKKNTGSNEAWKANNIYDIAGNCWEWTQEACSTYTRTARGGGCNDGGNFTVDGSNPSSPRQRQLRRHIFTPHTVRQVKILRTIVSKIFIIK